MKKVNSGHYDAELKKKHNSLKITMKKSSYFNKPKLNVTVKLKSKKHNNLSSLHKTINILKTAASLKKIKKCSLLKTSKINKLNSDSTVEQINTDVKKLSVESVDKHDKAKNNKKYLDAVDRKLMCSGSVVKSSDNTLQDNCIKLNNKNVDTKRFSKKKIKKLKEECNNTVEEEALNIKMGLLNKGMNVEENNYVRDEYSPFIRNNSLFKNYYSKIDFYQFSKTKVLLSLMHPCSLYFIGILEVEVLHGSVDVLGYNLDKFSGKHSLYSTKGLSHLGITTKEPELLDEVSLNNIASLYNLSKIKLNNLKERYKENIVLLILNKDSSNVSSLLWPDFVEKYSKQSLLPKFFDLLSENSIERALKCTFQVSPELETYSFFQPMEDWEFIFNVIKGGCTKTMVCGGKGVGKSTLLRYLVNRSLSIWKTVLVIDFDPGQSEFMLPGCVSAFLISKPLLGASFTHMLEPLRSAFYGTVDIGSAPKYYFDCVQEIVDFCNSTINLSDIPWFVNTMGFNKGFGVLVTSSVIRKINPSLLVQIESERKTQNFPSHLTPEFVEKNILDLSRCDSDPQNINYNLIISASAVKTNSANHSKKRQPQIWGISAASIRNIMILSYFSKMLNSRVKDIFHAEPYIVDISELRVQVGNDSLTSDDALDAVNGSLVGLCKKYDDTVSLCYGFGIVRAVSKETGKLFVLTPLNMEKLSEVNTLTKGIISLPDTLYTDPPADVSGQVPYVNISSNMLSCTVKKGFKIKKTK